MTTTIYMGTTQVPPEKTALEIQQLLQQSARVQYVTNEYANGHIVALRFCIMNKDQELWYRLPIRWEPVMAAMKKRSRGYVDAVQAKRTAWRQVLRWVEAQLALIEVGQTSAFEVFLPYMHLPNELNKTVGELFAEKHNMLMLPAGAE